MPLPVTHYLNNAKNNLIIAVDLMKLVLDKYAYLDSPIHRWEQNSKLLALLTLIFAFAFVQKLTLLIPMIVVTSILYNLSRLPLIFLLNRLRYPGFFILAVVIFIPFIAGETVIWQWGILAIKQEGCLAVLLIVTRFFCILTVSLVLFGTAPFLKSIRAMQGLGLPQIMIDMMLLSYRYLEELGEMLITMQRAMRLRGFNFHDFSSRNLRMIADLAGSLLVRSYEQSKRVYQAMILRGYGNNRQHKLLQIVNLKQDLLSLITCIIVMIISLGFILGELL